MLSKARLTEGPVGRGLFVLTLPMVAGMFAHVAFNLADTYFVAQLGRTQLAAMSFTFPVVMVVGAVALGVGAGAATTISRAIGSGDTARARRLATNSLLLGGVLVLALAGVGIATIDPVFRVLGAGDEHLPLVRQYMACWYVGILFLVIPMVGNNAIRATGDMLWPGVLMAAGAIVNVGLDPILIFGLWGFPRMELLGAALATVISRGLTLFAAIYLLHYRKRMLDVSWHGWASVIASWKAILHIGVPTAATTLLWPLSMGVITRLVSGHGEAAVAAIGAGNRIEAFVMMANWALSNTLLPFIGQNRGAEKMDRVSRARQVGDIFALGWGLLCLLAIWATRRQIAGLFTDDPTVLDTMSLYLLIMPMGYALRGVCVLAGATFNALHRPMLGAAINIIRMFCLYVPLAILGNYLCGLTGIFLGVTAGNLIAGIIAWLLTRAICRREHAISDAALLAASQAQSEIAP